LTIIRVIVQDEAVKRADSGRRYCP